MIKQKLMKKQLKLSTTVLFQSQGKFVYQFRVVSLESAKSLRILINDPEIKNEILRKLEERKKEEERAMNRKIYDKHQIMRQLFLILAFLMMTHQTFSQEFQLSDYDIIGRYSNVKDSCDIRVKKNQEGQLSLLVEVYPYKNETKNCAYFVFPPEYVDAFVSNIAIALKEYENISNVAYNLPIRDSQRKLDLAPCRANLIYKPYEANYAFRQDVDIEFIVKVEDVVSVRLDIEVDKSFYEKTKLPWVVDYVVIRLNIQTLPMFAAILTKNRIDRYKQK